MAVTLEYKCPSCGGAIHFDSGTQKMTCPFCNSSFDAKTLQDYAQELSENKKSDMTWNTASGTAWQEGETEAMKVYTCQSCGGQIVSDANTAATACPFCNNPIVLTGRLAGELKPNCVIPFKLDKKAAKEAFKSHLNKKRLLPKAFKSENHIDEIKGLYVPFWLFDADADANIRYRATRVRTWSDSTYDYTETSYYLVMRDGSLSFEKVPVDGSSKMADDLMESIEPFDYKAAVDFNTAYLAGYFADKYDVDAEHSIDRANERVRSSTEDAFESTVKGYDSVTTESSNIRLSGTNVQYALLPVWVLTTTWNKQRFLFAMNGQTGKFVGNLPVDKKAARTWYWGLTAGITAALVALSFLMGLL